MTLLHKRDKRMGAMHKTDKERREHKRKIQTDTVRRKLNEVPRMDCTTKGHGHELSQCRQRRLLPEWLSNEGNLYTQTHSLRKDLAVSSENLLYTTRTVCFCAGQLMWPQKVIL